MSELPASPDAELAQWNDYEQLAQWREAVDGAVSVYTRPQTVEAVDVPGALVVKVAPDVDGQQTALQIIAWCEPSIALLCPPDEEDAVFVVALLGAKGRDVVLVCGKPAPSDLHDPMEVGPQPVDAETADAVIEAVMKVLNEMSGSDDWHPFSAPNDEWDDLHSIFDKAFPGLNTAPDPLPPAQEKQLKAATSLLYLGPLREEVRRRRREQREFHRDRLDEHAVEIAGDLLDRENGHKLRMISQPERQRLIYKELVKDDPCVTKGSCLPVARAIPLIIKRRHQPD